MDSTVFKKLFSEIAKKSGFEPAFGGCFKESTECIICLILQKSRFSNYYYLNIKIYINGLFGNRYSKNKRLMNDTGDVFRRQPKEYELIFDLETPMEENERKQKLESFFGEFLVPFTNKALTRLGIKELAQNNEIALLPAVKKELNERMGLAI